MSAGLSVCSSFPWRTCCSTSNLKADEYIQTSPNELDRLLKTLVVDLEVKRLGNRRGRGRAPVEMVLIPSPDLYPGSDDEDDMEMAG